MGKMLIVRAEDKYTEFTLTSKSKIHLYGIISKDFNCPEANLKLADIVMAHKDGSIEEMYMVYDMFATSPVNLTASEICGYLIYGNVIFISKNNLSLE